MNELDRQMAEVMADDWENRIRIVRHYSDLHVHERMNQDAFIEAKTITFEGVAHVNIESTTEITVKGTVMAFDSDGIILAIYES